MDLLRGHPRISHVYMESKSGLYSGIVFISILISSGGYVMSV